MKKLTVWIAILLLAVTMFTSCGGALRFSKVVDKKGYRDQEPAFTKATELTFEGNYQSNTGYLLQLVDDNDNISLYNIVKNEVVWSGSNTDTIIHKVHMVEQMNVSWFYVIRQTEKNDGKDEVDVLISMYTAEGELIAESDAENVKAPEIIIDLIRFDGKVYRVSEKKGIQPAFEMSDLMQTPNVHTKAGDYYIGKTKNNGVAVYNSKLKMVACYEFPSYIEENRKNYFVLNNGNVLVQYVVSNGDYAEDYTFIENGEKYTLISILIDSDDGEYKEIDLKFVVDDLYIRDTVGVNSVLKTQYGLDDDIENLAVVSHIKNKRLDSSVAAFKFASLSNKAKLEDNIDGYVKGMTANLAIVAPKRWVVGNTMQQIFLLNEKGKVLGEVTNADDIYASGLILNNKVYDWNLKMVLDMDEHGLTQYELMDNSIICKNEDNETILYVNGKSATLIDKNNVGKKTLEVINNRAFVIMDNDDRTKFDIYSDKGELLYSGDGKTSVSYVDCIVDQDTFAIVEIGSGNGENIYLLLR